jgi:hypothetical protein
VLEADRSVLAKSATFPKRAAAKRTELAAERANLAAAEGAALTELPEGTTLTELAEGTTLTDLAEGTSLTELAEGAALAELAEGTTLTELAALAKLALLALLALLPADEHGRPQRRSGYRSRRNNANHIRAAVHDPREVRSGRQKWPYRNRPHDNPLGLYRLNHRHAEECQGDSTAQFDDTRAIQHEEPSS